MSWQWILHPLACGTVIVTSRMCLPSDTDRSALVCIIWAARSLSDNAISMCSATDISCCIGRLSSIHTWHAAKDSSMKRGRLLLDVGKLRFLWHAEVPEAWRWSVEYLLHRPTKTGIYFYHIVSYTPPSPPSPSRWQFTTPRKMAPWSPRGSTRWWSPCSMTTTWAWRSRRRSWRRRSSKRWCRRGTWTGTPSTTCSPAGGSWSVDHR